MIRDQALAVSGLMAERLGGPPVKPYHPAGLYKQIVATKIKAYQQDSGADLYRRSLYTYRKRSVPHPAMLTLRRPVPRDMHRATGPHIDAAASPQLVERPDLCRGRAVAGPANDARGRGQPGGPDRLRLPLDRRPVAAARELEILTTGFRRMLTDFRGDPAAADELLRIGESVADPDLDRGELAVYTTVASTLLNLDETITKD